MRLPLYFLTAFLLAAQAHAQIAMETPEGMPAEMPGEMPGEIPPSMQAEVPPSTYKSVRPGESDEEPSSLGWAGTAKPAPDGWTIPFDDGSQSNTEQKKSGHKTSKEARAAPRMAW